MLPTSVYMVPRQQTRANFYVLVSHEEVYMCTLSIHSLLLRTRIYVVTPHAGKIIIFICRYSFPLEMMQKFELVVTLGIGCWAATILVRDAEHGHCAQCHDQIGGLLAPNGCTTDGFPD